MHALAAPGPNRAVTAPDFTQAVDAYIRCTLMPNVFRRINAGDSRFIIEKPETDVTPNLLLWNAIRVRLLESSVKRADLTEFRWQGYVDGRAKALRLWVKLEGADRILLFPVEN